jgi:hypothetical protein
MDILFILVIAAGVALTAAGAAVGYLAGLSRGGRIAVVAIKSAGESIRGAAERG